MTTVLQYNFTSENVPGAYYGLLPELPHAQLSMPNGSIDVQYNYTSADLSNDGNATRWDSLYTIYFNRPDSESVYPSPSGYQYSLTLFYGHSTFGPATPTTFTTTSGPWYYNDTIYLFAPGDSFVPQLIELSEDGSTPTGNRFFGQNITLVRNETLPITTTQVASDEISKLLGTRTATATSSRAPPATTYPWTAEAATTTAAAASGGESSPAQTSAPANAGSRSTKGSSLLQIGTALLLISAAVGAF
ncbi:hypothetical protein HD553DRAFT_88883 [Filobasidium floriforme]|uniref:uncharacterized protein n=1 Tax=Filobasidium floriforme TaxID=5210 RepID=UPI001E8E2C87|nr:uncharacterized protein HD553DRAFT_88883 [Filobasidium floriforme]KAH8081214.1 hypothetical protein HD553DRAFT_88883 [Filobasidium floriforme]